MLRHVRREARLRAEVQRLRTLIRLIFPYVAPHPGAEDQQAAFEREFLRIVHLDGERTIRAVAAGRTVVH